MNQDYRTGITIGVGTAGEGGGGGGGGQGGGAGPLIILEGATHPLSPSNNPPTFSFNVYVKQ